MQLPVNLMPFVCYTSLSAMKQNGQHSSCLCDQCKTSRILSGLLIAVFDSAYHHHVGQWNARYEKTNEPSCLILLSILFKQSIFQLFDLHDFYFLALLLSPRNAHLHALQGLWLLSCITILPRICEQCAYFTFYLSNGG